MTMMAVLLTKAVTTMETAVMLMLTVLTVQLLRAAVGRSWRRAQWWWGWWGWWGWWW